VVLTPAPLNVYDGQSEIDEGNHGKLKRLQQL
jgi:hypothetical protein